MQRAKVRMVFIVVDSSMRRVSDALPHFYLGGNPINRWSLDRYADVRLCRFAVHCGKAACYLTAAHPNQIQLEPQFSFPAIQNDAAYASTRGVFFRISQGVFLTSHVRLSVHQVYAFSHARHTLAIEDIQQVDPRDGLRRHLRSPDPDPPTSLPLPSAGMQASHTCRQPSGCACYGRCEASPRMRYCPGHR